jgi:hypothetical protein
MTARPVPLRPDFSAVAAEHRRSLHRAIAVRALATLQEGKGRHVDAATIAKAAWPRDERVQLIVRAPQIPTSTADYPTFDPVTAFRSLAPSSAALRLFELGLVLDLRGVSTIRIPGVAGLPTQPIFVGEGLAAPTLQWSFVSTVVGPARKILLQAVVSNELDNATPETASAVIGRVLSDVANRAIDATAFGSAAADTTKPAGLLHNVTPLTAATAGLDAMSQDLSALTGAIGAAGIDPSGTVFVCGPREATIVKTKAGPKFDYPILTTLGLPPKTICCFAPAGVASGYQDPPTVETSREAVLHIEDTAPADIVGVGGAVAAPVRSMFQTDVCAIKVRANCAWNCVPGAAQVVANVNW